MFVSSKTENIFRRRVQALVEIVMFESRQGFGAVSDRRVGLFFSVQEINVTFLACVGGVDRYEWDVTKTHAAVGATAQQRHVFLTARSKGGQGGPQSILLKVK